VNAIKWDPQGNLLASCSDDMTLKVSLKPILSLIQNSLFYCLTENVIVTVLCCKLFAAYKSVYILVCQCFSSFSSGLGLSHWDPYAMHRGGFLELYYCNMAEWCWWDSSLIWKTNCFPSVLWHCWFGHMTCKNCPQYDL